MEKPKHTSWLDYVASEDFRIDHGNIELIEESPQEKQKHRLRRYLALGLLPVLCLFVAGWFLAGVYLAQIQIGTRLVPAHLSDAVLDNLIQQQAAAYRLDVVYPDGSKTNFSMADAGFHLNSASTLKSLRERQHQLSSRVQWWRPMIAYLAVTTDDSQFNSFIAQHATVTIQPAKDATIAIRDGKVAVSNSVAGKHYGLINPVGTLLTAVSELRMQPLYLQTLSTRPAITAGQLASSQAKLQKILKQNVTFIVDNKKVQASSADIAGWIEMTPKDSGKAVDVTVNSGKVLDYINKISAASIHPPKAQVETVGSGGTPAVLINGVNGTDIVNQDSAATEVAQHLLQGNDVQEALSVKYTPYKTVTANASGKWLEVDLTHKRMYAYEQSNLLRTFLVSAGAPATPTVTGQYAIYAKYVQQDMRGSNVDGSSYFQPRVPWINYFYQDYSIHGNYWRPLSYFGNINSSHGCVGVVDSDAEWIYSWAPIGTPVVVHV